jgi:hypothetical protein
MTLVVTRIAKLTVLGCPGACQETAREIDQGRGIGD